MHERDILVQTFLDGAGWGGARRTPLAGDASARRYIRLEQAERRAILMDAPPDRCDSPAQFVRVDGWLRSHGYSAPDIHAVDHNAGLMLLEDFGDNVFARLVAADPACEHPLYLATVDFLCDLRRHAPPPFVSALDGPALAGLLSLVEEWYCPALGTDATLARPLPEMIAETYQRLDDLPPVLSMRDFHAENLIWLPGRAGLARIGLLDFQDAVATHPGYDLVSLLQDARRDIAAATEARMIERYLAATGLPRDRFLAIYALLGTQRALRILAIFARLAVRDKKRHYLGFMPRVWAYLHRNLAHPEMGEIARLVTKSLPPPTPDRLALVEAANG